MIKTIASVQNSTIKKTVALLQKSRNRKKEGLFIVEGLREIERALACGYTFTEVFFNESWTESEILQFSGSHNFSKIITTNPVFEKIAYRESVKNCVGVAKVKTSSLADLTLTENPLVIVLETVEKPGNLGAILRSADAAGVSAVLVCDQAMDIYNPNVIRNSLGGFFNVPVIQTTSAEAIAFLNENNIQILATYLRASKPYFNMDMTQGTALVLGSEAYGISETWVNASHQNIIIPMTGVIDSLNVSSAASIVMFEAARQRSL